jgi:hypothetical protein
MFLVIAALLIQPALSANLAIPATALALPQPSESVAAGSPLSESVSMPEAPDPGLASAEAPAIPVPSPNPSAAEPASPAAPAPIILSKPDPHYAVSVSELIAESRHKRQMWLGLGIAEHGAAAFDAWSTRRAITAGGAHELNPVFKPFAGNASMYAAIQVEPIVMDFLARKMMYSRHGWVRHMWWVPQSASMAGSLFCGAHNLGVHSIGN